VKDKVNKEEYFKWLEEHGNKEESAAKAVVKEIIDYHFESGLHGDWFDVEYEFYPRKRLENLEFDLIIVAKSKNKTVSIGVEFKEYDSKKVIQQAILRRPFVDYLYVAIKPVVFLRPSEVFSLSAFGIGLIAYRGEFAWMITYSVERWRDIEIYLLEDYIHYVQRMLLNTQKIAIKRNIIRLEDFLGDENGDNDI